jgi:hypothetical protein
MSVGEQSMQTLQTIWATLTELKNNVRSLPQPSVNRKPRSPVANLNIPNLRLPSPELKRKSDGPDIPPVSAEVLNQFLIMHPTLIYKYVFTQLKKAIRDDIESITLFNMPHLGSVARIERKDYQVALDKMIEHFIEEEEYERVPDCQALVTQHHINEVIRGSK